MSNLLIKNTTEKDIDEVINLCVPPKMRNTESFIEGSDEKRKWALKMLELYGEFAKIACVDSKVVSLLQYIPKPEENIVEITCIFVPDKSYERRGIARKLFTTFLEDLKKGMAWFDGKVPDGVIVWAFEIPGYYPQHEFFSRIGFKRVKKDNPLFLYYPLKKGFEYRRSEEYIPQEEDKGKVLIFYDPSCPFCIYFNEKIKSEVRAVAPKVPIREINTFEEKEEVEKRGTPPFCVVNQHPIETSFFEKDKLREEVSEALKSNIAV